MPTRHWPASPDELRRILHRASVLLARVDSSPDEPLLLLSRARRSIAAVLAGVDELMNVTERDDLLTPTRAPATIEADR